MLACIIYVLFLSGIFGAIYLMIDAYTSGYNASVWFLAFQREAKCTFWWPLNIIWKAGYKSGKKGK